MIRSIIVDDEPLAIDLVRSYIEKCENINCLGTFQSALAAFLLLDKNPVDVIFIDIEMPGITGINFIKSLQNAPKIIFITAYSNFAVDAFELAAVDYIVKPVSYDRFIKALQRISTTQIVEPATSPAPDYIFIKTDRKLVKIDLSTIQFIEGAGDYCKVHLGQEIYLTYMTMNKFQQMLPPEKFTRIHRSTIVRDVLIKFVAGNFIQLGDHRFPIGQKYKEEILEKLNS